MNFKNQMKLVLTNFRFLWKVKNFLGLLNRIFLWQLFPQQGREKWREKQQKPCAGFCRDFLIFSRHPLLLFHFFFCHILFCSCFSAYYTQHYKHSFFSLHFTKPTKTQWDNISSPHTRFVKKNTQQTQQQNRKRKLWNFL